MASLLLTACGDPLVERQLIVDTRVLAVKVAPTLEPGRALARPGESVAGEVLVAPEPTASWALEACVLEPTTTGLLRCRQSLMRERGQGVPRVEWAMPEGEGQRVGLVGLVCDGAVGDTRAAWPDWSCRGGKENPFSFEVNTGESHRHPVVAEGELRLDDEIWSETTGCVSPGSTHTIVWTVPDAQLEPVDGQRERLFVSHFVTAGELERPFSTVTIDDRVVELEWVAPTDERDATFYLVVRDQRGGVDWTTRSLCSEREEP